MKKQIYTFIITSLLSMNLHSQSSDTIYLWPDKVPNELAPKQPATQTDNTKGDVIRLTDVTNPLLTIYKPSSDIDNGTSIIVCPGGGYTILAIDKEGYEVAEWLADLGYTAYVLQYRVPQKRAGALQDLQRAIRLVRHNSDSASNDKSRVGLLGFSAGGHLCAVASTQFDQSTYEAIDDADQNSSRPDFTMLLYAAYLDQGQQRTISPELILNNQVPPMFVFATADDMHANSSLIIAKELRDNKIPVELHLLPNGGHGYGLRHGNYAAETWPLLAEKWLNTLTID